MTRVDSAHQRPNLQDSIVVIGSGPAGAMAAIRLVERGWPVTLLEAGTAEPRGLLLRAFGRNLYRRTPEVPRETKCAISGDPTTRWYRAVQPGGLSNQWTGAVPRFAPADFFDGRRLHLRYRWPLDYSDLVPYYESVERLLVVSGARSDVPQLPAGCVYQERTLASDWQDLARAAERRGQGLAPLPLADGPSFLLARRAGAFNSYTNLVRRAVTERHLTLYTGCTALRLEWSGATRRVESVVYHDVSDNSLRRLRGAAFVIACGALASTKLLFDSACPDFPEGLGNESGVLGRYLHDHPKEWWSAELDRPISRMVPSAYLTRRPFDTSEPLTSTSWTIGVCSAKDKVLSLLPGGSTTIGVNVFGSMVPTELNYVAPHPTLKDKFGLPQLDIRLAFDDRTLANMARARRQFGDLMEDAGYRATIGPVVPQCNPGEAVHYGGTVRMHDDPQFGSVDSSGRLFHVPNVAVVDASTFTTSSEKNPTLTVMALAARAADRLAWDLRS